MEELLSLLYLGDLQQCIAKGESMSGGMDDEALRVERDVVVYRAFLGQGRGRVVLDEVPEDTPHTALQAVKLLARYALGEHEAVVEALKATADTPAAANPTMALVTALVYEREGRLEEALRAAHGGRGASLELRALMVTLYARLWRWAEAEKELKLLQKDEEDHVLTVLAAVRLALAQGGTRRCADALAAIEEQQEKMGATALTLTLAGQCCLACGRLEEAEQNLRQALTRDSNSVTALYALHVVLLRMGKHQLAARALAQATAGQQSNGALDFLGEAEKAFDEVMAK